MRFETLLLAISVLCDTPLRYRIDSKPQYHRTPIWKPPERSDSVH